MNPTQNPLPKRWKVPRAVRAMLQLAALCLGIFLLTFWIIARRAEAKLVEAAERIAPALASELGGADEARAPFEGTLYLNGLPLHVETRNLPGPPPEQASLLRKECRGFAFEAQASQKLGRAVVCLRAPRGKTPDLAASLERYAQTSDLSELGSPEISFLRSTERNSEPMTQLLQVRALSLDLHAAFPTEGDAPGLDPTFAPRPVGRRILSVLFRETSGARVREPGTAREILFAYETPEAPDVALERYERSLTGAGFRTVPTGESGPLGRAFESDEAMFFAFAGAEGPNSWISLALLPRTGRPGSNLAK